MVLGWLQVLEDGAMHSTCAIHPCLRCCPGDLEGRGSGYRSVTVQRRAYLCKEWKIITRFEVHFQILGTPQE